MGYCFDISYAKLSRPCGILSKTLKIDLLTHTWNFQLYQNKQNQIHQFKHFHKSFFLHHILIIFNIKTVFMPQSLFSKFLVFLILPLSSFLGNFVSKQKNILSVITDGSPLPKHKDQSPFLLPSKCVVKAVAPQNLQEINIQNKRTKKML